MSAFQPFRLDRSAFDVVPLDRQDDEGTFWAAKSPEERLRALEYLRRMAYGSAATEPMRRVFEVVALSDM